MPNNGEVNGISIHALLAESDQVRVMVWVTSVISIHALLAESDGQAFDQILAVHISIHALLAESDVKTQPVLAWADNFYPRSPCGERPLHKAAAAAGE